ncbi:hypothetical protein ACQ26G_002418 [Yersinia enterocolitica]|uniref:hypothetical protein n=1 Tax=Yersinia enterocolitica TaxID=630 RepID=UPI0005DE0E38|nr:hypothetical protein [Yersinia enterocolitica]EKN3444226.1 hypothetical protein [Yersinia enterocolitica]EKN4756431.1 hypothetical protein [Yersinia enterocolitica]EKN4797524.1 hypothetical protein [Yersinia enterocolitica]EKN5107818.1 hypothetical protein [Yersinia enterocolitica]CQH45388.1 Uncharacterised protein [Yersinia enterocolitica]
MNTSKLITELHKRNNFTSEQDFIDTLYFDINTIIRLIESSCDKYYCDDEDKISHVIVSSLTHLGYTATEQTKKNGSVDITVSSKDGEYDWIAEAKIGYGNQKIFEGLLQLLTRYVKRDNHAGIFIYYQKARSTYFFKDWLKYLHNHTWGKYCSAQGIRHKINPLLQHLNISSSPSVKGDCCWADVNVIKPSSDDLNIRFFYIDLHHEPLDKSGVNNKSIAYGQARNKLKESYHLWKSGSYNASMDDDLFKSIKIMHDDKIDDIDEDISTANNA